MKKKSLLAGIVAFALVASTIALNSSKTLANQKYLTVKGSDTMVHLVSAWAESYMKSKPGSNVSVTGGGSGTGIAALINGTTDVAAASRDMKAKEKTIAQQKGITPKEIAVAKDGIAIVVNPKNPVKSLSMDQLKKIYTGKYTNWKQVGGVNKNILVLSRESSSGTYVFFQEHVLDKQDYSPRARLMSSTSSIMQSVSSDSGAIGYAGLGYAVGAKGSVKTVPVKKTNTSVAILPSEKTIKSGSYPIARDLYFYVKSPESQTVKNFINFTLSSKGQQIVRQAEYIPIK
ncbi:MAG: hypothetical protein A2104_00290 [Candidatus Melainabacteria bacterium GWF2_32_7]|nr:MAG: hypothetical protein A2104_00290 [Candidatus Melainabacteria bacterium GWF2_32_7]